MEWFGKLLCIFIYWLVLVGHVWRCAARSRRWTQITFLFSVQQMIIVQACVWLSRKSVPLNTRPTVRERCEKSRYYDVLNMKT